MLTEQEIDVIKTKLSQATKLLEWVETFLGEKPTGEDTDAEKYLPSLGEPAIDIDEIRNRAEALSDPNLSPIEALQKVFQDGKCQ